MIIEIFGLIFSIVLGTVGHFLHDWFNKSKFVSFFFSTDESIWQHLKLGITPIMLWTIIELITISLNNLFFVKFVSILVFVISLLFLYYLYKFFAKRNILFLDISIFYVALAIAYYVSIKLFLTISHNIVINFIGILGFIIILFCYKIFNKN